MRNPVILVVDDDPDFAISLGDLISNLDCDVTVVFSAEDALAHYERHAVDLVFMDRKMPGMDGISCTFELRRRHPDAQVVIVTGHYDEGDFLKVTNYGLLDVLDKPVDIGRLNDIIEKTRFAPTILIADDDAASAYAVSSMLATQGYRVRKVTDGRQAIDTIRQTPVELMIMDLYMPVMNGHEVCMELRKTNSMPPTILTTSFPDSELMHSDTVTDGLITHCLIKPVGTQQLYKAVDGLLGNTK